MIDKSNLMDSLTIAGGGGAGVTAVEMIHQIPTGSNTIELAKIIMQGIITLVTLFGIGKKIRNRKQKKVEK